MQRQREADLLLFAALVLAQQLLHFGPQQLDVDRGRHRIARPLAPVFRLREVRTRELVAGYAPAIAIEHHDAALGVEADRVDVAIQHGIAIAGQQHPDFRGLLGVLVARPDQRALREDAAGVAVAGLARELRVLLVGPALVLVGAQIVDVLLAVDGHLRRPADGLAIPELAQAIQLLEPGRRLLARRFERRALLEDRALQRRVLGPEAAPAFLDLLQRLRRELLERRGHLVLGARFRGGAVELLHQRWIAAQQVV